MQVYRLGDALVEVGDEVVTTTFADGSSALAHVAEQPGQSEVAARLGISVESMNRGHDLAHSLMAVLLGRRVSPTLWAVAHGRVWEHWWREEAAVLEFQALASVLGVTIPELAGKYQENSDGD